MSTIWDSAPDGSRDKFIAPKDVNQMARALDDEKIQLVMTFLVRSDDPFPFSLLAISFVYDTKATEHDTEDRM